MDIRLYFGDSFVADIGYPNVKKARIISKYNSVFEIIEDDDGNITLLDQSPYFGLPKLKKEIERGEIGVGI